MINNYKLKTGLSYTYKIIFSKLKQKIDYYVKYVNITNFVSYFFWYKQAWKSNFW